jgi:hypothetical protein
LMRSREIWRSATEEEMERGQLLLYDSKAHKASQDPTVDPVEKKELTIANGVIGWRQKMDRPGPNWKHPSVYVDPWNKWRTDGKCGQICGTAIQEGDDEDKEIQTTTKPRAPRRTTRVRASRGGAAAGRGAIRGATKGMLLLVDNMIIL